MSAHIFFEIKIRTVSLTLTTRAMVALITQSISYVIVKIGIDTIKKEVLDK